MPLDTSIPLQANLTGASPLDTAAKAMTLKHLMQQDQLAPLQMESAKLGLEGAKLDVAAAKKAAADAEMTKKVFQDSFDPQSGKLDKKAALSKLYGINPEMATKLGTTWAKEDQEFRTQMQEEHGRFIKMSAPLASSTLAEYDKQVKSGVPPDVAWANLQPRIGASLEMLRQQGFENEWHGGDPSKITPDQLRAIANQSEDTAKFEETKRHNAASESFSERRAAASEKRAAAAATAAGEPMTDAAVDELAHSAMKDRMALANIGRGTQGANDLRRIVNRMAEIKKESGDKRDIADIRAQFHADAKSNETMTKQYDAIISFEKNADRNGDRLVELAKKVDTTGKPVVERWIRAGRKAVQGDPDVSEFNAQLQVFRTEAARILTNPNLTGVLSDSARKEIEDFVPGDASAEQIDRVVKLLKGDFTRRKATLEEQLGEARNRMATGALPGSEEATGGKGKDAGTVHEVKSDADYDALPSGAMFTGPDGKQRQKP